VHERQAILKVLALHAQRNPGTLEEGDTLADIGLDSLKFIVMMLDIERLTQRKVFELDNVGKLRSVGDILALAKP
jgi:acyl carrier protein